MLGRPVELVHEGHLNEIRRCTPLYGPFRRRDKLDGDRGGGEAEERALLDGLKNDR